MNYKIKYGRWGIDNDGFITDMQTGIHCLGKIYDGDCTNYTSKESIEIKLPVDIKDFNIDIPSGELWIKKDNVTHRYGTMCFIYFGERNSKEQFLFNTLVMRALLCDKEAIIELIQNLARTFYFEKEIEESDFSEIQIDELYRIISDLIHDKELRFKFIQLGAFKGNIDCMYDMGTYYTCSDFVKANIKIAIKWYIKAARKGSVLAMSRLSHIYGGNIYFFNKSNYIVDFKKMFYWKKRSAGFWGYNDFFEIAECYETGKGTGKNYRKAFLLYMKIAEYLKNKKEEKHFCGRALYEIGCYYYYGLSVKRNFETAIEYFNKAKENGYELADDYLVSLEQGLPHVPK